MTPCYIPSQCYEYFPAYSRICQKIETNFGDLKDPSFAFKVALPTIKLTNIYHEVFNQQTIAFNRRSMRIYDRQKYERWLSKQENVVSAVDWKAPEIKTI